MFRGQDDDSNKLIWDDSKDKLENIQKNIARVLARSDLDAKHQEIAGSIMKQILEIARLRRALTQLSHQKFLSPSDPAFLAEVVKARMAETDLYDYMQSEEISTALGTDWNLLAAIVKKSKEKPKAERNMTLEFTPIIDDKSTREAPAAIIASFKSNKEHITEQEDKTTLQNFKTNLDRYLNDYTTKRHTDVNHLAAAKLIAKKISEAEKVKNKNSIEYLFKLKELNDTLESVKLKEGGLLGKSYLFALVRYAKPLLKAELVEKQRNAEEAIQDGKQADKTDSALKAANLKLSGQAALYAEAKEKLAEQEQLVVAYKRQASHLDGELNDATAKIQILQNRNADLSEKLEAEQKKSSWLRHGFNHLVDALNTLFTLFGKKLLVKIEKTFEKGDIQKQVDSATTNAKEIEAKLAELKGKTEPEKPKTPGFFK
jgi:hypothetical protein